MRKYLAIIVLFIALYQGAKILYLWDKPNSDSPAREQLTIVRGDSLQKIIDKLFTKKLIRDPWIFRLFLWKNDLSNKLQAGEYIVP